MRVLIVDVGGTNVKVAGSWRRNPVRIESGPELRPADMVRAVRELTIEWKFDAVSLGYPGPVRHGVPLAEPVNLGTGWVRYNYERAFGVPVRVINDAAMQALGSYDGGRMLFLGLGTGLGSALVDEGCVLPLEMAHLPYWKGRSYEDYLGADGLKRLGRKKWEKHVHRVTELFLQALVCDYVVLGGGNVERIKELPRLARRGSNALAVEGGIRLWSGHMPAARRRDRRSRSPRPPNET
ncbi:MAG: ROK family protein [Gemmatimonadaceae bacterium]